MFRFDYSYVKKVLAGLAATAIACTNNPVKPAIAAAFTFAVGYYAGIQSYLIAIGMLVVIDVITGIWAAFTEGEKFSSKKLGRGLIQKSAVYLLMMASAFEISKVLQSALHYQTYWLPWILTLLILLYELSSIVENAVVINPELAFLKRFSGLFEKVVDKQVGNAAEILGEKPEEKKDEDKKEEPAK